MSSEGKLTGCLACVWTLFVTTPMWLILLFAMMSANDMPASSWALYWCYVPAQVLGVIVLGIAKAVTE